MNWTLDIGSGHAPNQEANLFLERYLEPCLDREGRPAIIKENMIVGDALFLPFKNKSIYKVISNHVIEHTDNPWKFIIECQRVSDNIHITAPGLLHEIWRELAFESSSYTHKWVAHPVYEWISMQCLIDYRPKYTAKQELYLKLIRLLPVSIKHMVWTNLIHIMNAYMKNVNVDIVEYEYKKETNGRFTNDKPNQI